MADIEKVYGNRWRVVKRLGRGGQANVYEVTDMAGLPSSRQLAMTLKEGLRDAVAMVNYLDPDSEKFQQLIEAIRFVVAVPNAPRAALKELLPVDQAVNAKTATARMKNELETLGGIAHPALVKVLDEHIDENWFVMEFFREGSLEKYPDRFKGRVLDALVAFRPIVQAVQNLHIVGIVHRDIKPANVFVADDGHLVLGDCGLAIRLDNEERLTEAYENVGSRDWMPPWAQGMRVENVTLDIDVFGLGKLLWAMVSGRKKVLHWYHNDPQYPQFNLKETFPGNPDINWVTRILDRTVVQYAKDCLQSVDGLLGEIDNAIDALTRHGQVPTTTGKMKCRFCGVGIYERFTKLQENGFTTSEKLLHYRCNYCGHMEEFFVREGFTPAWNLS